MEKKYQVFVSSTLKDLSKERQAVTEAILKMDQIPIGMESFNAGDEAQWALIKRNIDRSDYYIVIIGNRYGSLTSEGISYTEKEYRYAVETGKPVLAFLISGGEKSDEDYKIQYKLAEFKELATNKMADFWTDKKDLAYKVSTALYKEMKRAPGIGWIRANEDNSPKPVMFDPNSGKENDGSFQQIINSIINKAEVIELEGSVKRGGEIYILSSQFNLDSEKELISTILKNVRNGCYYRYIFHKKDLDDFLLVCSLWWNQFKSGLLSSIKVREQSPEYTDEYNSIIASADLSSPAATVELFSRAKQYFLKHIDGFMYKSAFVATTIALYEKANGSFNEKHRFDFDIIIPLPTIDGNGYYAYHFPNNREYIITEIVKRVKALCNNKDTKRIQIDLDKLIKDPAI